jgi:hypothetical protein
MLMRHAKRGEDRAQTRFATAAATGSSNAKPTSGLDVLTEVGHTDAVIAQQDVG